MMSRFFSINCYMAQANPTGYSFSQLYIWGTARGHLFGAVVRGIAMVSSFFVVATLSVYHYGLYQLVLTAMIVSESSLFSLFDDIVSNDLARAFAGKRLSWAKKLFHEIAALKLVLGILISAALFFGAGLVASYYGKDIAGFIRILSILALIKMIRGTEGMFFGAILSFVTFGAGAMQEIIRLIFLVGFWLWGSFGLREVLLSSVFSSMIILAYTSFFFFREYQTVLGGVRPVKERIFPNIVRSFGKWIFIRQGFSNTVKQLDVWFIRFFLNTEAVGLYALAVNLLTMVQGFFPLRMLSSLLPWEIDNPERMQYIYRRVLKYFIWIGVAAALGSFFIIPQLIGIFLPKYLPVMPIFRLMALTLPLFAVYKFQKILLIVLREQKVLTMRLLTETFITAIVWVVALPVIGLYAAVVEFTITYIWRVSYFALYLQRHPFLAVKLKHLIAFDREDREIFGRALYEILHPTRWFKPIRAKSQAAKFQ